MVPLVLLAKSSVTVPPFFAWLQSPSAQPVLVPVEQPVNFRIGHGVAEYCIAVVPIEQRFSDVPSSPQ